MNSDANLSFVIWFCVIVFVVVRRIRKPKRVFITDYQRGIRYVRGSFANLLGPGSYLASGSKEHIDTVDMRPQPIILERTFYRDSWQNDAFVTIGAELQVSDARLPATMLKDQVNDSLPLVRDALRSVVTRGVAGEGPRNCEGHRGAQGNLLGAQLQPGADLILLCCTRASLNDTLPKQLMGKKDELKTKRIHSLPRQVRRLSSAGAGFGVHRTRVVGHQTWTARIEGAPVLPSITLTFRTASILRLAKSLPTWSRTWSRRSCM